MAAAAAAVAAKLSTAAPAPSGSGLSLDQKKKLLWGGKKKEVKEEPAPQAVFGQNRWDRAEFGSEQDRLKFIKLMGGKAAAETLLQHGPALEAPLAAPGQAPPAYGPALPGAQGPAAGAAADGKATSDGPADYDPFQPDSSAAGAGAAQGPALYGPALPGDSAPPAEDAATAPATGAAAPGGLPVVPDIMRRDAQARVLTQLEREFESGLRRQLGGNRAAGLGAL